MSVADSQNKSFPIGYIGKVTCICTKDCDCWLLEIINSFVILRHYTRVFDISEQVSAENIW